MSFFFKNYKLEDLAWMQPKTIHEALGIEITAINPDGVSGKMPVDERTFQPFRLLHGGANVVLAESLGSLASSLIIDPSTHYAVGLDINANHVRPVKEGFVYGTCKPLHIGKKTHVWSIEIINEQEKLVCVCRLTMSINLKQ